MKQIDPATLVAYRDGELDRTAMLQVERALAADPALRLRLEALQRVDSLLGAAFDPVLSAPLPALHLTERAAGSSTVPVVRPRSMSRLAWAAGIGGLIVGFAAGQVGPLFGPSAEPAAAAVIQAKLSDVLETELSGTTVEFHDPLQGVSGTVKPVSTFLNADGRYCRAYEARASNAKDTVTSRGIACRDGTGHWLPRVQLNVV